MRRTLGPLRLSIHCLFVAGALLVATPATASPLTPTSAESAARQALAANIPGARVVWSRGDKVYEARAVTGFATTTLVTQGSIVERNPRFSPDGTQLLTDRSDGVYLMKSDFSGATKVISGGHTASWTRDGKAITAIDSTGYKVLQYDLAAKTSTTIYDAQQSPYNGQQVSQAAELRQGGRFLLVFRLTPSHVTEIVDLQQKTYISNQEMQRGDCSPAWAPDGSYTLNTARTESRPVLKANFSVGTSGGSVTASTYLVGLDTSYKFYIHGQRVSNNGKYVAFGGIIFDGPLLSALREIYIWRIGDPDSGAVRISFDTAEDEGPDLYVPPGCVTAGDCNDSNPCTTDSCSSGSCQHAAVSGCCTSASQCNDSDACTSDICSLNKCQHSAISGCCTASSECNDNNLCTTDSCTSNKCQHSAVSGCCTASSQCDDGIVCTTDVCTTNKCQQSAISGCCTAASQCDDNNSCTTDVCTTNKCQHSAVSGCCTASTHCNDSNPCTTDSCDVSTGECSNQSASGCCAVDTDCDDANACSLDKCESNKCQHSAISGCCAADSHCDDNNPCTTDSCDVSTGKCSSQSTSGCCAYDTDCDDADPCSLDKCVSNACQHSPICGGDAGADGGPASDATSGADGGLRTDASSGRSAGSGLVGGCSVGAPRPFPAFAPWLLLGLGLWLLRRRR